MLYVSKFNYRILSFIPPLNTNLSVGGYVFPEKNRKNKLVFLFLIETELQFQTANIRCQHMQQYCKVILDNWGMSP